MLDTDSASIASQTTASWTTQKTTPAVNVQANPATDQIRNQISGTPIAVVQQSPVGSILNGLGSVIYLLIFGLGAGIAFGDEIVSIAVIVAVVVLPVLFGFLFRPKYEFYDSGLLRVSRSGRRQVDYSQMKSVNKSRSRIVITLQESERDFRRGRITIPRDPKLPDGMELSMWLQSKLPHPKTSEQDETSKVES